MRYASKKELLDDIEMEHRAFLELAATVALRRYSEPGVWGDGWNIKDLFAHLTAWEQLFLGWYRQGREGLEPEMPARGWTWRQTPALNRSLWRKHRRTPWKRVRADFDASYEETLTLARSLPEGELMEPGQFAWTRKNAIAFYLGANTASHYRTARKILERWLRAERGGEKRGRGKHSRRRRERPSRGEKA